MSTRGWVLAIFLTLIVSLVIYAKTEEGTSNYAYFRAYYHHDCVWYFKGDTFKGERVVDVLENIGSAAPFITTLREEDVPQLLNFFDTCGWEVVSHSARVNFILDRDKTMLNFTCILRRK